MKADIFYLTGQKKIAKIIDSLLRVEVYRDIEVSYIEIDPKYNKNSPRKMHERCREYLRLLKSSLLTSDPFDVIVKNDSETHWCYLGIDNAGTGGYCFELNHMHMPALFPAVAILERIVMMPEDFHEKLSAHPRTLLSLSRPLDLGGVELFDYRTQTSISHSVQRVSTQIKHELRNLCYRHMSVRRILKPDFEELSYLLKVDSLMLESEDLFLPDVRIEVSILESQAVVSVPSTIVLGVRNEGGRVLKDVRVRVRAPHNALSTTVSQMIDIIPPDTTKIKLEVTPIVAPCCPLEIFFDQFTDPTRLPSMPIPVLINVTDPEIM